MDTDTSRGGGGGERACALYAVSLLCLEFFLSPVAGQVVDVGARLAGGVALLRVDLGFGPTGEKK